MVKYIKVTNKFEIIENKYTKEKVKLNCEKWDEELLKILEATKMNDADLKSDS